MRSLPDWNTKYMMAVKRTLSFVEVTENQYSTPPHISPQKFKKGRIINTLSFIFFQLMPEVSSYGIFFLLQQVMRSFLTLSHPKWKKKCPARYQHKRGAHFKYVSLGVVSFGLAAVAWGACGAFACSCSDGHSLRGQSRESWGKEGHMLGLAILPHKQVWRHAEAAALVRSLFVFNLFKNTCRTTQNLKEMS